MKWIQRVLLKIQSGLRWSEGYNNDHQENMPVTRLNVKSCPWFLPKGPESWFIIKMQSYQDRDYHYKSKTVSRPSYLCDGNNHTWKDNLSIETGPWWPYLHQCPSVQRIQFMDQSRYAPSQWETSLHCNDVSHWLGTYLNWSLQFCPIKGRPCIILLICVELCDIK